MVLNTRQLGGGHLSHEIFYWQGKESTQVIMRVLPLQSTVLYQLLPAG